MAVQTIFKRSEIKYILTPQQIELLKDRINPFMSPDIYGLHTISSIYFDNAIDTVVRTSIQKPVYKEKLRLRSYGARKRADTVFLELKKKFKGTVYKRRIALTIDEAAAYLRDGTPPKDNGQIFREIDYFVKLYKAYPKIMISYDRVAYIGNENPDLRLTLDYNVRARRDRLDFSEGSDGECLLDGGRAVMELKISNAMPMWLCSILSELKIYPSSFSKYGTEYTKRISDTDVHDMLNHEFGDDLHCSQVS